jgi:hypothetical protein
MRIFFGAVMTHSRGIWTLHEDFERSPAVLPRQFDLTVPSGKGSTLFIDDFQPGDFRLVEVSTPV